MSKALSPLEQSDEEVLQTARQLRTGYGMKRVMRYWTTRDHSVHSESNGEHVFGLLYLASYFLPLEDPEGKLDVAHLHRILCFHDFPEMKHGDTPTHHKTVAHEEREAAAALEIFAALPPPLDTVALMAWTDYEEQLSPEARFAYALDKIEPVFELFDPINELTCKRVRKTYENYRVKKIQSTEKFPIMRRFVDVISADMRQRGVFWVE